MEQSDQDIAARLATDLNTSFTDLLLLHQQRLYTFILRQTGNAANAEDIVQETFVRAYYALQNYPEQKVRALRLRPWLTRIALNVLYNRWRDRASHEVSLDAPEESAAFELEDDALSPDEEVWRRERKQELERLVCLLPEHYRTVITLYYFEELSQQEIAALLHQPPGTIRSKLHRGLALLRQALSEYTEIR